MSTYGPRGKTCALKTCENDSMGRLRPMLTMARLLLAVLFLFTHSAAESFAKAHGDDAGKLGDVNFSTSCKRGSRAEFNRAVALLHSFEYDEARKAFAKVSAADPQCAMAYWGLAMSHWHPLWAPPSDLDLKAGSDAIEKATRQATTEREKEYISALREFYKDPASDHNARVAAYEAAMENLYRHYPDDHEAAIFYALSLLSNVSQSDKEYSRQKKAGAMLTPLFTDHPSHPGLAHYIIHAYDSPQLAELALPAAKNYARIAPASAHAQHMPSHIFTRLGLWPDVIDSNITSTRAARLYAVKHHIKDAWDEEVHGMDYLIYAYLQLGDIQQAKNILDKLGTIHTVYPDNLKSAYAFAAMPARYALERRQWAEASALDKQPASFRWDVYPQYAAINLFAKAIGAARSGDAGAAKTHVNELSAIKAAVADQYWRDQVDVQFRASAAWLAFAEGKTEEALKGMREAADLEDSMEKHPVTPGPVIPARELLGDMLVDAGKATAALTEYELSLQRSRNRLNGICGAIRAAERSDDRAKKEKYLGQLTALLSRNRSDPGACPP